MASLSAAPAAVDDEPRLPVTILTGYLGAGKTTLLNRILSEDHGRRYAVIVNEFGEIGIDGDLVASADLGTREELFEMNNGCICCTVRGDLIRTLHGLLGKAGGGGKFDAIIIETTGLADPGPVLQTFFVDPFLAARTFLDSVTTLVDAKHVLLRLEDSREAVAQIAFADQIVVNKSELVGEDELRAIAARLNELNPLASIHLARRADVALERILGRGAFDLARTLELVPADDHVHDEHCGHRHQPVAQPAEDRRPRHDESILSVSLRAMKPLDGPRFDAWISDLVATRGADILRAKGIIDVAGEVRRLVVQSVHMLLEGDYQRPWQALERRSSRLVLIGRHLDQAALQADFDACAAAEV